MIFNKKFNWHDIYNDINCEAYIVVNIMSIKFVFKEQRRDKYRTLPNVYILVLNILGSVPRNELMILVKATQF